eukprot:6471875-Amphidinium_carterae.2
MRHGQKGCKPSLDRFVKTLHVCEAEDGRTGAAGGARDPRDLPQLHPMFGEGAQGSSGPRTTTTGDATRDILRDIAASLAAQDRRAEEEKLGQPGTLAGVTEEDKLIVFAARGFDRFDVALCPAETGRELARALKKTFETSHTTFRSTGFPTLPTNRIILGSVKMQFGGKDHKNLGPASLSVADFPTIRDEEAENYSVSVDWKLETRPREPPTYLSWQRQARNEVKAFGCLFGTEHNEERLEALDWLCNRHEGDNHKFPLDYVKATWEELHWHWCEGMREEVRRCK